MALDQPRGVRYEHCCTVEVSSLLCVVPPVGWKVCVIATLLIVFVCCAFFKLYGRQQRCCIIVQATSGYRLVYDCQGIVPNMQGKVVGDSRNMSLSAVQVYQKDGQLCVCELVQLSCCHNCT